MTRMASNITGQTAVSGVGWDLGAGPMQRQSRSHGVGPVHGSVRTLRRCTALLYVPRDRHDKHRMWRFFVHPGRLCTTACPIPVPSVVCCGQVAVSYPRWGCCRPQFSDLMRAGLKPEIACMHGRGNTPSIRSFLYMLVSSLHVPSQYMHGDRCRAILT